MEEEKEGERGVTAKAPGKIRPTAPLIGFFRAPSEVGRLPDVAVAVVATIPFPLGNRTRMSRR